MSKKSNQKAITALKVRQWLASWDDVKFDPKARQSKPDPFFYLFTLGAKDLKALTGVYRRSTREVRSRILDPNVQRGHQQERSDKIQGFVKHGYPLCDMGETQRKKPGEKSLRKPGWLPTAILVNILKPGAVRSNQEIPDEDIIKVEDHGDTATIHLPATFKNSKWKPSQVFPLEVIDGQHRLWAFENFEPDEDFELPVVAFNGLDRSWQAYLFWSVNITPKRINKSLAYDLYPLLRQEEWLDKFEGHSIYRETRCQELVEAVWAHPYSPWNQRINMLGETISQRELKVPMVSQAAWIRSLMATLVKEWNDEGKKIGGLFGAQRGHDNSILPWNRAMQAAFIIFAGKALQKNVKKGRAKWAMHLRSIKEENLFKNTDDKAFFGEYSLLTTDQGIRGFLFILNDLCFIKWRDLKLSEWRWETIQTSNRSNPAATEEEAVSVAIKSLKKNPLGDFIDEICAGLSTYDWRASSTPGLDDDERRRQAVFRGSGGYREMRLQLLPHLEGIGGDVGKTAKQVLEIIK
jgi:DGQHR domain-containing protein